MSTVKKGTSIGKEILARLAGDNKEVLAEQIARKCMSAVDGQIASLKADLVDREADVDDAIEELNKAKFPTTRFKDNRAYCASVIAAQENVLDAQENLQDVIDSIATFTDLASSF